MKKMLTYNFDQRPSAEDLLKDSWITQNAPNATVNKDKAEKVLKNLQSFNANQKLMEITISYIVNQLISQEEIKDLKNVFLNLDKNGDGKLSYEEILEGFVKVYGEASAEASADHIFSTLKKTNRDFITYEEFITASMDRSKVLTEQKIDAAFRLFDKNGDGFISPLEIKNVIGKYSHQTDEYWMNLVKEVDQNGDGEISLDEFKSLMMKALEVPENIIEKVDNVNVTQSPEKVIVALKHFNTIKSLKKESNMIPKGDNDKESENELEVIRLKYA